LNGNEKGYQITTGDLVILLLVVVSAVLVMAEPVVNNLMEQENNNNNITITDFMALGIDAFMLNKYVNSKPKYMSASLKQQAQRNNEILKNTCTNCGSTEHDILHCRALTLNLTR
jgi:hypothetical protein